MMACTGFLLPKEGVLEVRGRKLQRSTPVVSEGLLHRVSLLGILWFWVDWNP